MRYLRSVVVLAALAVVLSACGLVNALVPDQDVNDPLGIDGQTVTLSANSSALGSASTQALSLNVASNFAGEFDDIDTSEFPAGVHPKEMLLDVALRATAILTSATGVLPDEVEVTAASLTLTVADGSGSPSVTVGATAGGGLLTLEKIDSSCVAIDGCAYTVTPAVGHDTLLSIDATGQDFLKLWSIATSGSEPNTVAGTFGLELEPNVPQDTLVEVTISAPTGTFKF